MLDLARASGKQIQHYGQIEPAFPRPDIGDVGGPDLVGRFGLKLPIQQVLGHRQAVLGVGGGAGSAADGSAAADRVAASGNSILAGIQTSAVINVGTATLGALIGAGGYGQPILTSIRLNDTGLILQGAVPAAVLALVVQGLFGLAERAFVAKGLRIGNEK